MPVKKEVKSDYSVGDKVIMILDADTDVPVEITKLKGDNFVVEDSEGTVYECEPDELKPAKKKKPTDEDDEKSKKKKVSDENDEKPKKKKSWADIKPANKKDVGFPVGTWEALAFNGLAEENDKGEINAYIEFVGVNDEAVNGTTQRRYFGLRDADKCWTEGVEYFKTEICMLLGIDDPDDLTVDDDDPLDDINKYLKKLRKKEPWVSIKAKKKGEYINIFLQGMMDDQDEKPKNPIADLPY